MAFLEFKNIRIAGVSAGVPKNKIETKTSSEDYSDAEYIRLTGIKEKRQSDVLTASDLCYEAAVRLLDDLEWKREEVDAIFFCISVSRLYSTCYSSYSSRKAWVDKRVLCY